MTVFCSQRIKQQNKKQKELFKRSSLTLKSNSMCPEHFSLSMNLSSATFGHGCFFSSWPLTPQDLRGPMRSYWWPLSLFPVVITAANSRLLALSTDGLFGKNCTCQENPLGVRPLSAFFFFLLLFWSFDQKSCCLVFEWSFPHGAHIFWWIWCAINTHIGHFFF